MDSQTRVLNQLIALGENPNDVDYEVRNGHAFIVLGNIQISASLSSQAALDKLAIVAAQAAADNRGRALRKVA